MTRIDEIRARLDAWRNDGNSGEAGDYFDYYDIAWLLAEVERLREIENNRKRMSEMLRKMLDERCEDD